MRCEPSLPADAATRPAILPALTPPRAQLLITAMLGPRHSPQGKAGCCSLPAALSICSRCLQIVRSSFARLRILYHPPGAPSDSTPVSAMHRRRPDRLWLRFLAGLADLFVSSVVSSLENTHNLAVLRMVHCVCICVRSSKQRVTCWGWMESPTNTYAAQAATMPLDGTYLHRNTREPLCGWPFFSSSQFSN